MRKQIETFRRTVTRAERLEWSPSEIINSRTRWRILRVYSVYPNAGLDRCRDSRHAAPRQCRSASTRTSRCKTTQPPHGIILEDRLISDNGIPTGTDRHPIDRKGHAVGGAEGFPPIPIKSRDSNQTIGKTTFVSQGASGKQYQAIRYLQLSPAQIHSRRPFQVPSAQVLNIAILTQP